MFDALLQELISLKVELDKHHLPLLIGGGMGLFLRDTYLTGERQPRYPVAPPVRSTQDLDVLLAADLIADAEVMTHIRDALAVLGYQSEVDYFQFAKTVVLGEQKRKVKIDLLAAPPREEDRAAVKIKPPRIRPHGSEKIHAYLTAEARYIDVGKIPIELQDQLAGHPVADTLVYIPSSFNYLILKLHAFADRKDRADSDFGRHHALDIFRIVTDMTEEDWENAGQHYAAERDQPYLRRADEIRARYFAEETDLGILRLKENALYQRHRDEFDGYIPNVLQDLRDLFRPGGT